MKKRIEYLQKIGLSEIEAQMYIKLLKSGSLTVAQLAEKVKMNRTALYPHIEHLLEKGVIAQVKGSTNKYVATSPENLQFLVEQKITEAHKLKASFPSLVNALYSTLPKDKDIPQSEMRYYKGMGVKSIYEECLKTDYLRSYFNVNDIRKVFPENPKLFMNALASNPKMKIYEILEYSQLALQQMQPYADISRYICKYLPKDVKLTANDILIYDGKVAIINVKKESSGIVLHNKDYYDNSKNLFDLLWRLLPDPQA